MDFLSKDDVRQSDDIRLELQPYLLSQYSASPTIYKLLSDFRDNIRPDADIDLFRQKIMNIETAEGFGLDVWGNILGIKRSILGIDNETIYTLADNDYRKLLIYKALANILDSTMASLNKMLNILLEGVDIIAVNRLVDGTIPLTGEYYNMLPMHVRFSVKGNMTDVEKALFVRGGLLCLATGVGWSIVFLDGNGVFGFRGSELQPFNQGVFVAGADVIDDGSENGDLPVDYSVIITQSENQTISVVASKDAVTQTYTDSFVISEKGWNLQILVEGDSGYLAGNLIINGIERTDGQVTMKLEENLTISATEAEQGSVVYMNGNVATGWNAQRYRFYSDLSCTEEITKSSLTGKIVVFDISNGLPADGEGLAGANLNAFSTGAVCSQVTVIDVSDVDVSQKTSLKYDFAYCGQLRKIIGLDKWNPQYVGNMASFCRNASYLTDIGDISRWQTPSLTSLHEAFRDLGITSMDMSGWYTPNLVDVSDCFNGDSSLRVVDISGIDTTNISDATRFFSGNTALNYVIMDSNDIKFSGNVVMPEGNNTVKYLVKANMVETYKAHANWSSRANRIESIDNYDIVRVNGQITVTPKEV